MVPISLSPILGFRSDLMSRTIIENPIFGQFLLAHHQSFRRRHCSDSAHVNTEAPPTMRNASFALKQGEREIKVRTFDFSILQKERERDLGASHEISQRTHNQVPLDSSSVDVFLAIPAHLVFLVIKHIDSSREFRSLVVRFLFAQTHKVKL
ncbi:hypothetical protein Bca4012_014364 [Brassica carinata]